MGLIWMIPVGRSRSLVTRLLEWSTGTGANRLNERWGLEIRPFPLHILLKDENQQETGT